MRLIIGFIFMIFVGFVISEFFLHVFSGFLHYRTEIKWRDDETVGRRLASDQKGYFVASSGEYKSVIAVNSEGWRDTEHKLDKEDGVYRILLIGDSFVENFQEKFENSLPQLLSNKLKADGEKVEVISMGLGDTGTSQQYLVLTNYGLKYNPDLVVHFFFNGNDVVNNSETLMGDEHRPYFNLSQNGMLQLNNFEPRTSSAVGKLKSGLKNNSLVFELLFNIKGKLDQKSIDDPVDYHVYDHKYNENFSDAWRVTDSLILASKNIAKDSGADYLLVSIAANEQVNNEVWGTIMRKYNLKNLDQDKPDDMLRSLCAKNNLNCLFTLKNFKQSSKPTHYRIDGHLTTTGDDILSDMTVKAIEDLFFDNVVSQN